MRKRRYWALNITPLTFIAFVSPVLVLYGIIFLYPFVSTAVYALVRWDGVNPVKQFVGLDNFKMLLTDSRYLNALYVTFKFAFLNVIFVNVMALFLAVVLNRRLLGIGVARSIFFIPNVISMVIVGFIWQFLFLNVANEVSMIPGLGFLNQGWMGDPDVALYSVVIVSVWRRTGYMMTIYLAGLQTVDRNLIDASKIDGSSEWQRFRYVTLPLIVPAITSCLFLTIVGSLKTFDIIFAMTEGGPGYATEVISINIFFEAFMWERYGYATAKAIVFTLIILIITYMQVKLMKRKEVAL